MPSLFGRKHEEQALVIAEPAAPGNTIIIEQWIQLKGSQRTQDAYRKDVSLFFRAIGQKSLGDLTLQDVLRFRDSLAEQRPASIARRLATIKSLLTFCCKTYPRFFPANVGAAVTLPKMEEKLAERILPEEAIQRMLAAVWLNRQDRYRQRNYVLLRLLYGAALRREELCALRWRNVQAREIDGEATGQVSVFGKGSKSRAIVLSRETWTALQSLRGNTPDDAPVFVSRRRNSDGEKRLSPDQVYRIVRHAAQLAGIEKKVSPHWLRHAHASHALDNGAPITLVRDTLGHSTLTTTSRYSHARPQTSSGKYLKV